MYYSLFEIFSIGVGPSSSHTVGPMRAAKRYLDNLRANGDFAKVARLEVTLYGSLALTGLGHGTIKAIVYGLMGLEAEAIDPEKPYVVAVERDNILHLGQEKAIPFVIAKDIIFAKDTFLPEHSNGMKFAAFDEAGKPLLEEVYFSVGGGTIARRDEINKRIAREPYNVPHQFDTCQELLERGEKLGLSISDMVLQNEVSLRTEAEVRAYILKIHKIMQNSIERGMKAKGILPGGLGIKRRAAEIYASLEEKFRQNDMDSLMIVDWINLWGFAVAEENAAGGQIVTAPTMGSAGILPANKVVIPARPEIVMQPVVTTSLEPVYSIEESSGIAGTGGTIEMTSAVAGSGSVVSIDSKCKTARIDEDGGVVIQNVSDNVKMTDDYWVDVPLETEDKALVDSKQLIESSFADANNRFCIQNQAPYENLNAQNLYKVRASIVSVENAKGQKGAGLIIANNLVLTSADLMVKDNNSFKLKTINGKEMKAAAMRVNPNKNVALLLLDQPTQFAPLPLSLDLPEVNKDILLTLGLLDFDTEGEGYLDNEGKVIGYRWSENGDAEIIVDTFVQTVTLGGALIDKNGNIVGLSHKAKKTDDNPDLFIPIETALKGLGLEICGRDFGTRKPVGFKAYTPLADAIDASKDKTPVPMKGLERK